MAIDKAEQVVGELMSGQPVAGTLAWPIRLGFAHAFSERRANGHPAAIHFLPSSCTVPSERIALVQRVGQ